ncbi:MAG: SWIM zinc finger domain-containing protein, partial [Bradymonadaceae bacterium]
MAESEERLTTDDVLAYVGETYAGRGQNYFYDDRIMVPRVRGETISAKCIGSKPEPYEVKVGLCGSDIRWSTCSCPVPDPCKHVAALLFTYIEKPESFQHPERLQRRLRRMDKTDLVDLLIQVADRDPDIERFLERRVLTADDDPV